MGNTWRGGVVSFLIAVAGCIESGQADLDDVNTLPAGERASSMGVTSYRATVAGDRTVVGLLGIDDVEIGRLELSPVAEREAGLEGEIQTAEMVASAPQLRVRYRTPRSTTEVGIVRLREHGSLPDTTIPVSNIWQAALTDPALQPLWRERGFQLAAASSEEQAAYDERRAAASADEVGYVGEWACFGHRINPHAMGWEFWGCGGYHDNEVPTWGRNCAYSGYQEWRVHRTCDDSCCNGSCASPAAGALSSACQAAGYGNAGCRVESTLLHDGACHDDQAPVVFFEHDWGQGESFGGYYGSTPEMPSSWNDRVSSISVQSPYVVKAWEHSSFGGDYIYLESGLHGDLDNYNDFNDRTSSYEIWNTCGVQGCNNGETCTSCPQDCGACPVCGDGDCTGGETCETCSYDCGECTCSGDYSNCFGWFYYCYDCLQYSSCGGVDVAECSCAQAYCGF